MLKPTDIVLINGLILADPRTPVVVPHVGTIIRDGLLFQVNVPYPDELPWENVIDCSKCLIMPGLVNCHNHAAMSLFRGAADDLVLSEWLNNYIFPAESRFMNKDTVYLGTCLSAMESVLNGTTTVADAYFYMEQSAAAHIEVGLRTVCAQGIVNAPTPDCSDPENWKKRVFEFLAQVPQDTLVSPALFCHSPYLCSPETYSGAAEITKASGMKLFSHVAETAWESNEIHERFGKSSVQHLRDLKVLNDDFVAVHCVHLSQDDIAILSDCGASVVHCPESNLKLSSGGSPVGELLRNKIPLGIGTDGPAGNNNLDMFEEMRTGSLLAKFVSGDPRTFSAKEAILAATYDGARVLGLENKIGSLEPGKCADLIVLDLKRTHLTPLYDAISHLVYSARGSDVRDVFIQGKRVVANRTIKTVKSGDILKEVQSVAQIVADEFGITNLGEHLL